MRREGQLIVDLDFIDVCCWYATTRIAKDSQDDIFSIPLDKFKHYSILFFELTSVQDTTENWDYP